MNKPAGFCSPCLWRARVSGVQGFPTERHEQGFPSGHPVQWYSVSFWNSEEFIKGFPQHSPLDPAVGDCFWGDTRLFPRTGGEQPRTRGQMGFRWGRVKLRWIPDIRPRGKCVQRWSKLWKHYLSYSQELSVHFVLMLHSFTHCCMFNSGTIWIFRCFACLYVHAYKFV